MDESDSPIRRLPADKSEHDLMMRLELARKNSLSQDSGSRERQARRPPLPNPPLEDTIYESEFVLFFCDSSRTGDRFLLIAEEPPASILRPSSRASRGSHQSKESAASRTSSDRRSRSSSRHGDPERRPLGPRPVSPLPPKSPTIGVIPEMSFDLDSTPRRPELETPTRRSTTSRPLPSPLPLVSAATAPVPLERPPSRRERGEAESVTPRKPSPTTFGIEPLSIKKKSSVKESLPPAKLKQRCTSTEMETESSKGMTRSDASPNLARSSRPRTSAVTASSKRELPPSPDNEHMIEPSSMSETERGIVDGLVTIAENTKVDVSTCKFIAMLGLLICMDCCRLTQRIDLLNAFDWKSIAAVRPLCDHHRLLTEIWHLLSGPTHKT